MSSIRESDHLEVLLISPVRMLDPAPGDVTYTEQLVACPPPGVHYTTYDVALADGRIIERYRKSTGLRPSFLYLGALAREAAVKRARRRELLFRETFRHFDVDPSAFDLIHAHVFATAIYGTRTPLIVSNALGIADLYRDAFRRAPSRVALQARLDRALARATGVSHASYPGKRAIALIAFSDHLRHEWIAQGVSPERISVIPPSVEVPPVPANLNGDPARIGFIGDWESKGGAAVLEAHRRLRADGHRVELVVVGTRPRLSEAESRQRAVRWLARQERHALLADVIPTFSMFVYPSRCDGTPLTLLEVMACGIPAVVSDYKALPEVVDYGRAGRIVSGQNVDGLVSAILSLMDLSERRRLGRAARERVMAHYTAAVTIPELGRVYRSVLSARLS